MKIGGVRRVRSGHKGSHHKMETPEEEPKPPKTGKGVKWRDHILHHERGHSSFMDLEASTSSSVLQKTDDERIADADSLWYKASEFEEERKVVKSEFFRRLGEVDDDPSQNDQSWNRLTAYSGQLGLVGTLKPRSYEEQEGVERSRSPTPPPPTPPMSREGSSKNLASMGSPPQRGMPQRTGSDEVLGSFRKKNAPVGLHDFSIHGLAGEGAFGKVMMATKIDTQKVYAMKVIRKELLYERGDQSVKQAITEKQVLQQMASRPHPYVISLRYAFQTDDNIFLVMDLVGGGDLFQLLEAKGRLPEDWVVVYAAEVALALEHVHSYEVLFRDLKPENVMIGVDGHLKLTDFGLSKRLRDEATGSVLGDAGLAMGLGEAGGGSADSGKTRTRTICGTPEYIAPEVLQGKPYHSSIDWWTYGCLVYEMVHGGAPFRSLDMGSLVQLITRCRIKFKPEFCSPVLEDMLRKLIKVDADSRLGAPPRGADSVKEHPFFSKMDWEALMRKEVAAPCALSEMYDSVDGIVSTQAKGASKLQKEFATWSGGDEMMDDDELQRMHSTTLRRVSKEGKSRNSDEDLTSGGSAPSGSSSKDAVSPSEMAPKDSPCSDDAPKDSRYSDSPHGGRDSALTPTLGASGRDSVEVLPPSKRRESVEGGGARGLSLELTRTGAIWAISHSLVRALGYGNVGKQSLLGRSMTVAGASLVEARELDKFCEAFDKARESLDERLNSGEGVTGEEDPPSSDEAETDMPHYGGTAVAASKGRSTLSDVTIWLTTANAGRVCMQCSFEVTILDASFHETGGPAGLITLNMIDVTAAETKKAVVARRYQLAYNDKAPDAELADFFASWMEESTKAVPVPGSKRRSTPGIEGALGVRQPGDPYSSGEHSSGVRAYLQRRRVLITAFPDLHFTMLEQTTQGGSVYTSWQWTGTHLGPYPDESYEEGVLAPTGARVHVHGISIDLFEGNHIVDHSVFYDENAIRAQLEIKASASRGRDTRSIIRRAHNARQKLVKESAITVQLYLSVRKEHGGSSRGTVVGAMMRPVISTAPRYSVQELTMMSTMEAYYASKATAQIGASCTTNGFCLCDGGDASSTSPLGSYSRKPGAAGLTTPGKISFSTPSTPNGSASAGTTAASIILCSHAFARIVDLPGASLLRADLHAILEPAVRASDPQLAARLAEAIAKREPFHAVFEGRFAGSNSPVTPAAAATASPANDEPSATAAAGSARGDGAAAEAARASPARASPTRASPLPGRIMVIDVAPFVYERRVYWSVLLSDLSDDLVLNNVDLDGRVRPDIANSPLPTPAVTPSQTASGWMTRQGAAATKRPRSKPELADLFVHCIPSSWRWFGCKMLQNVITAALNACKAALSLSDLRGEDAPLVWTAEGFTRMTGWARNEVIGRNCRFLQSDASDLSATHEMRRAVAARHHTRVYIWNEDVAGEGFWSIVSISPGRGDDDQQHAASSSEGDTQARYMMGVQHRMTKSEMRFVFERVIAYRTAFWERAPKGAAPTASLTDSDVVLSTPPPIAAPPAAAAPAIEDGSLAVEPPPADLKAALSKWRKDFTQINGRKPTAAEVSAMVTSLLASDEEQEEAEGVVAIE